MCLHRLIPGKRTQASYFGLIMERTHPLQTRKGRAYMSRKYCPPRSLDAVSDKSCYRLFHVFLILRVCLQKICWPLVAVALRILILDTNIYVLLHYLYPKANLKSLFNFFSNVRY